MSLYEIIKTYIQQRSKTVIRGIAFSGVFILSGGALLFSHPNMGVSIGLQFIAKSCGVFVLAIASVLGTGLGEFVKDECIKPRIRKYIKNKKSKKAA